MGYANTPNNTRALSILLLGVVFIALGLATSANAASSCSAEIQKAKDGSFAGCVVQMGNRQFTVGAAQTSAEGCSQVCSIMAEVGGAKRGTNSAKTESNVYRQ